MFTIILVSACGRKNNNFFVFSKKETIPKINKLTLPIVRKIKITKHEKCIKSTCRTVTLQWKAPKATIINELNPSINGTLIGYNIYKFLRSSFISRKTLNKTLITTTTYTDKFTEDKNEPPSAICYVIRAVYKITHEKPKLEKIVEGPTSKIVCAK